MLQSEWSSRLRRESGAFLGELDGSPAAPARGTAGDVSATRASPPPEAWHVDHIDLLATNGHKRSSRSQDSNSELNRPNRRRCRGQASSAARRETREESLPHRRLAGVLRALPRPCPLPDRTSARRCLRYQADRVRSSRHHRRHRPRLRRPARHRRCDLASRYRCPGHPRCPRRRWPHRSSHIVSVSSDADGAIEELGDLRRTMVALAGREDHQESALTVWSLFRRARVCPTRHGATRCCRHVCCRSADPS